MPDQKTLGSRLKHAWNAFLSRDPTKEIYQFEDYGYGSYIRPDRPRFRLSSERTIVTAIFNRIALDVAAVDILHVRLDEEGRFLEKIDSGLQNCLSIEANLDQTGRAFIQDIVMSMLDEGCIAIVPVDTSIDPRKSGSFDIQTMRTGFITEWYPQHVKISVYNEATGKREEIILPKRTVSIIENPFYSVFNEQNSLVQRLIRKLSLLDYVDEQNASGKLNMIIQLPYIIKTDSRRQQAENRRSDIEKQLTDSKYGIAYTDGTERITQLGRPLENSLPGQIEYLIKLVYGQLGMTEEILNGTADEKTMLNYHNRTIEPIVAAIADELKRKFLTKTARTQGQSIEYFKDPFRLVPVNDIAEIADKFTRNEIMTSNEIRQAIGMRPSNDPKADELRNSNLYPEEQMLLEGGNEVDDPFDPEQIDNEVNDEVIDGINLSDTEEVLTQLLNEKLSEDLDDLTEDDILKAIDDLDDLDRQLDELEKSLQHKVYASPYYDPVKAHEYYMKNRKLKGRTSTSGLNDKGKEAAQYVKKRIQDERKSKVEASKANLKSRISKRQETKKAAVNTSKINTQNALKTRQEQKKNVLATSREQQKQEVETSKAAMKGSIESSKLRMNEALETLRNTKISNIKTYSDSIKSQIKGIAASVTAANKEDSENLKKNIESRRDEKNSQIEAHKNQTQNRIDLLKERLKGLGKSEKAAQSEAINKEIAQLRDDNAAKREELNNSYNGDVESLRASVARTKQARAETKKSETDRLNEQNKMNREAETEKYKQDSETERSRHKDLSAKEREEHKERSNKSKEDHKQRSAEENAKYKADSTKLREAHKELSKKESESYKKDTTKYREEHKTATKKYKEEADNKYVSELDKIKADSKFQRVYKRKRKS